MRGRLIAVGLLAAVFATGGCGHSRAEWLDGSAPEKHGFPADLSKRIDSFVDEQNLGLLAVLVVKDDRLVADRYYDGVERNRFLHLYSATKSVTGLLVGIAIAEGKLAGLDAELSGSLPPELLAHADRRVRSMTLRELLSMTTGLGEELSWLTSADWDREIVEHHFFAGPSGSFSYSTAGTQLLSAALENATGESLLTYAERKLFEPLGIVTEPRGEGHPRPGRETESTFGWAHDSRGQYAGG
jgi:CubicO group peptidase (beta-lactamase class C family)